MGVRAFAEAGIRVEGSAAAPLAVALREELPKPLVLIVTGRNIDDDLYDRILTNET
jgi:threonine dehydratase